MVVNQILKKISQPYKNPKDKRIAKRIQEGKMARGYDWWEINQVKNVSKEKTIHPCPIPEELAKRIIVSTANDNQLIIDPFCGTGTVLRVAKNLGYEVFGTEIDRNYYEVANKI
jgi:site-specific DNA-methyltransferase (adenine-specific)